MTGATQPIDERKVQLAPHLVLAPAVTAPDGSTYVHHDLVKVTEAWAVEQHISPLKANERFGDVASWVAYVTRFSMTEDPGVLLTWTRDGLRAVLDYHANASEPDRCQWTALHPFERTREWECWSRLADGRGRSQRELIEALEDYRDDVKDPDAATLLGMLRTMRATINAKAESTLEPNGETSIKYERSTSTSLKLPATIKIGIPVLRGHTVADAEGVEGPVKYELDVRIRVDPIGDDGRLGFRLTIPKAEQALEDAVADRVNAAKALLGDGFVLLRATS